MPGNPRIGSWRMLTAAQIEKKYILKYLFFNLPVVFLSVNISQHNVNFKLLAPIGLEGKKEIYV